LRRCATVSAPELLLWQCSYKPVENHMQEWVAASAHPLCKALPAVNANRPNPEWVLVIARLSPE
jgi:hypothetical protein